MNRIIAAAAVAAAIGAPGTASAAAATPSRHEALRSATSLLHDDQVMRGTLGRDAQGEPLAVTAQGRYWRSLTPKIKRVRGGWKTCAVAVYGRDSAGNLLVRFGHISVKGFKGGFSTTLKFAGN